MLVRQVADGERPLVVCLRWAGEEAADVKGGFRALLERRRLVLQENETGLVNWAAFGVPELERFLGLLDHEEGERVDEVRAKYGTIKRQFQRELRGRDRDAERSRWQREQQAREEQQAATLEGAARDESHA